MSPVIAGLIRIHRPQPEHIGNRGDHADTSVRLGKSIGNGPKKLAANIHRTAAHPLGNTAGFINEGARYFYQDQVAAGTPFILHNAQHIHIEGIDFRAVHHGFRIAMHAFLHIGQRKEFLRRCRQDTSQCQAERKSHSFYFLA